MARRGPSDDDLDILDIGTSNLSLVEDSSEEVEQLAMVYEFIYPSPAVCHCCQCAGTFYIYIQSLCKSLREKVRAQHPEEYHELLLSITPPPMGKTTRRELSRVEKGMIITFFWFFSQNLYY